MPRWAILAAGAVLTASVAAACGPVEHWVPDVDGDGTISQAEVDQQVAVVGRAIDQAVEQQRREVQLHPFLTCIRHHESDRGAYPHTNGYAAENPRSSASGAYQYIDSTWRTVSAQAGHPGYARAKYAPAWVQDAVTLWVYDHGGAGHWRGTGC
jgi:hypothetical protein